MSKNHTLVTIEVALHYSTPKAYLVSDDGNNDHAVWIPKSQCELEQTEMASVIYKLTAEEQLLVDKGLV